MGGAAEALTIGVLGTLVVRRNGSVVEVTSPRMRTVLVTLAHRVGEIVRLDELFDALWGDDPPASARNVVQVQVSHLRRMLGPAFDLRTEASGYRLISEAIEVDVDVFERLAAAADDLLASDPSACVDVAQTALDLWRGEPAASTIDIGPVQGHVVALHDLRTHVRSVQIQARLQSGEHRECCADAAQLADEHPYREDIRELHLLALYRSGRQTEALATYRRTRELLVEELGIEPGPSLRELQRLILVQDPSLDPAGSAREEPVGPTPLTDNLKPEPNTLVDRREIDDVQALLEPRRLVTLVGTGGIGKSRCVAAVARRTHTTGSFADGVWLVDLAPLPDGTADIASTVASAIGLGTQPDVPDHESIIQYLTHRNTLIVLDNCEHIADAAAAFARDVTERVPTLAVLAASRVRLGISVEHVVTLERLTDDAAAQLVAARIEELGTGPFSSDECRELCAAVDNYPLALELAAARTRSMTPREISARLTEHPDMLRRMTGAGRDHRHADVSAALDWSLEQLSASARSTLERTTVFVSDFDLDAAEAVLSSEEMPAAAIVDDLGELVEHHLINRNHGRARFRMLEPIRQHLAPRAPAATHGRYSDRYVEFALAAARGLRGPDEAIWWDRVTAELPHVREIVRQATERGDITLLDHVLGEMAFTYRLCAFADPGEWAVDALRLLDLEPNDATGITIAAAAHHAHLKQHTECEALLDAIEVGDADHDMRARILCTRAFNDPAATELMGPWLDAARAGTDPAMRVLAEIQGTEASVVELADRHGNPTLRVFARQFLSARILLDRHSPEARANKQEILRIALASNNNDLIANGQSFMALQHALDDEPEAASRLLAEAVERFVKGRSPFWIWHVVEVVAVVLAMFRTQPFVSEKLWAAVTASGTVPFARLTRDPANPEWVASQLTADERRQAAREAAELDMDTAAREARKAAEQLAAGADPRNRL